MVWYHRGRCVGTDLDDVSDYMYEAVMHWNIPEADSIRARFADWLDDNFTASDMFFETYKPWADAYLLIRRWMGREMEDPGWFEQAYGFEWVEGE